MAAAPEGVVCQGTRLKSPDAKKFLKLGTKQERGNSQAGKPHASAPPFSMPHPATSGADEAHCPRNHSFIHVLERTCLGTAREMPLRVAFGRCYAGKSKSAFGGAGGQQEIKESMLTCTMKLSRCILVVCWSRFHSPSPQNPAPTHVPVTAAGDLHNVRSHAPVPLA